MKLDVGCGEDYLGDVNVDLYPYTTQESRYRNRNGFQRNLTKIPNFINASINHLPFKDNAFDIVYCHHLLEHKGVILKLAFKELIRVCNRKLIMTVPSCLSRSKMGTNHDKIVTRDTFYTMFKGYDTKIRYTRYRWRDALIPLSKRLIKLQHLVCAVKIKNRINNPLHYLPCPIPTELHVEVTKR